MSPLVKSDAVVLRAVKFGESSRIVTFFTENFGKLAGIVKGARRPGNRFGSTLQPMSQVSVVIYRKPGRDVQTVSQCDHLRTYARIATDLDRISAGMQMVELVGMVLHEEEENREVYRLLTGALGDLDAETISPWPLFYDFEVQLADALGFRIDFSRCAGCGRAVEEFFGTSDTVKMDLARGGPVCRSCDSPSLRGVVLTAAGLKFLMSLTPGKISGGSPATVDPGGPAGSGGPVGPFGPIGKSDEIENFISQYFIYHLPGFRKLRSGDVFRPVTPAVRNF